MSTAIHEWLPERLDWPAGQAAEALPNLPAKPGVWVLLAEGDVPVLAATSQNMRASVAGRLTAPDPAQRSKRTDLSQTVVACRYSVTHGRLESDWLYGKLVHAVWSDDFWERVGFAPMWMLKASPVTGIMKLQPTTAWPSEPDAIALGPMITRSDAQDLADALTDLFDLCRYWQILAKAPHGTPCAYHEMGRSPAPCAGLIPMDQYNQTVRDAMAFAGHDRANVLAAKEDEMKAAAANLQFEQAARIKDWLKRAAALDEARYAHLAEIERFVGVAVSRFRTKVQPFFFRAGILEAGDPVKLSQIEEHLPAWRVRLEAGSTIAADDRTRQWQCGLMATHIFRADQKTLAWMPLKADAPAWLEAAKLLQSPAATESRTEDQP
jgi:excinuclease UvrABC nuclease subunit